MSVKYSVLMSVYAKENPKWFDLAIASMMNQTIKPDEFVIVKDGKLTAELDAVIGEWKKRHKDIFKIVFLKRNMGLGLALRRGVTECNNEIIARMDSDDYSDPTRIEKEIGVFNSNPEIDMVGTNVVEFENDMSNIVSKVILPETHDEIYEFSKKRCPFRHPSLLYKKSAVLAAGNYRDYHLCEDYDLYVRMLKSGCKCYNLQEPLTYMRISDDFYKRRGGIKYLKSMMSFKNEQLRNGYFSLFQYIKSSIPHIIVCLSPNFLRCMIYRRFLRG